MDSCVCVCVCVCSCVCVCVCVCWCDLGDLGDLGVCCLGVFCVWLCSVFFLLLVSLLFCLLFCSPENFLRCVVVLVHRKTKYSAAAKW